MLYDCGNYLKNEIILKILEGKFEDYYSVDEIKYCQCIYTDGTGMITCTAIFMNGNTYKI